VMHVIMNEQKAERRAITSGAAVSPRRE
jgi:hypothetical protein